MSDYYILERSGGEMLLYSLPNPSRREHWLFGQRFTSTLEIPVVVHIQDGYETTSPSPFFSTPSVMRNDVYEVLVATGVNNLDVYDAVLRSGDGSVEHSGYKVFNILNTISAADLSKSTFANDNPSRSFDTSFESLNIDSNKTQGLLIFRLREYAGAIVVHKHLKEALELKGFPHLKFTELAACIS